MMIRVSGGQLRGQKINVPAVSRPTSEMVKQAMFNIIGSKINDADVFDLFAGSGSLGIEALSRGARSASFNDISTGLMIRQNLAKLKLSGEVTTLPWRKAVALSKRQYDVIFLDPPYHFHDYLVIIKAVLPLLKEEGVIVLETKKGMHLVNDEIQVKIYVYNNTQLALIRRST